MSAFSIVEHNGKLLAALRRLFHSGNFRALVKAGLQVKEADHAYSGSFAGSPGKLIIRTK